MLEALHTKLYGQLFYGVEVTSFIDDDLVFQMTALKAIKGELNIVGFSDQIKFEKNNKKKVKANLVVNTVQVLNRVSTRLAGNIEHSIDQLFPNLDISQFYYQSYNYEGQQFISICRKKHIDGIVAALKKMNINVDNICLGNTVVSVLKEFSSIESLTTSNARINLKNVLEIEKRDNIKTKLYSIEGIDINNFYMLSFLAAANQSLSLFDTENNLDHLLKFSHEEHKQYLIFYYGLRSSVITILMILMVNFYYFNSYYDDVSNNPNVENESLKKTYASLKAEVNQKDKLINQILQNQSSSTSQIINDLIKTLPATIQLSAIAFQPLSKSIKKGKPIELASGKVVIKGETNVNGSFTTWNTSLENLDWVNNVTITKFQAVEKSGNHQFELKIQMNQ
ncbi:hypothetical protein [Psychroflexus sp. ALD_RP9]|uniref:hypothetical protein n=1 Tax=Psychroflexus sp. ALD_RP9 TaxID=2777186 RepID=UPI001A8D54F5|nr:hypothetical protein [Psychroflexus sp. ALD_RP9]QSS96295.1 hypothetical protein IMZ30_07455 [Psychroflexus sp. ALD_RP9]